MLDEPLPQARTGRRGRPDEGHRGARPQADALTTGDGPLDLELRPSDSDYMQCDPEVREPIAPRPLPSCWASVVPKGRAVRECGMRAAAMLAGRFAKTSTSRLPTRRRRLNIDNPCERQLLGQVGRQRGEPAALAVAAG